VKIETKLSDWVLVLSCFILVSSTFVLSVDSYGSIEDFGASGGNNDSLGYELLNNGTVFHMWNQYDDYYFNRSNGVQFTNHYEEYWTKNVLMLGYYAGGQWNLLHHTDSLSGFTRSIGLRC